ncbi:hypothetical protein [Tsuneonella suprasediminis]|uniref:hypothetical protein n=1 Tax=Tsuneonella suprasediminis TaxID=2306996 RepID=UPI002F94F442
MLNKSINLYIIVAVSVMSSSIAVAFVKETGWSFREAIGISDGVVLMGFIGLTVGVFVFSKFREKLSRNRNK